MTMKDEKQTKMEELALSLAALTRVNSHLNSEVESLTQQVATVEGERDEWRDRARRLAAQLAQERRSSNAAASTSDGADGGQQQQAQADRLLEAAAAPVPAALITEWSECEGVVATLMERGRAGGWLLQSSEVSLGEQLGEGAFGATVRGAWRGTEVAVKRVRISTATELSNFVREADALSRLRHPCVVPFIGAVVEGPDACWLVSEFMPGGTLAAWLAAGRGGYGSSRPLLQRLRRGLEVAQALAAMEGCAPPLLHRDVKPSNIFLDGVGRARLGDFGLARPLPASRADLTGETGTYTYMSPEMIRHEVYDGKTDMWSFGVLLAELISGLAPYEALYMTPVQVAMGVADEQLRPWLPVKLHPGLLAIAAACCGFDPELRPSFSLVVQELGAALQDMEDQAQAQAQAGGLLGLLLGSSSGRVPASWVGVLSQPSVAAAAATESAGRAGEGIKQPEMAAA